MIVDEMHEEHPELLKDQYWDEVVPKDLPYTVASEHYRREEPKGSAECYKVKESDSLYANMAPVPGHHMHRKTAVPEDMYADYVSVLYSSQYNICIGIIEIMRSRCTANTDDYENTTRTFVVYVHCSMIFTII